MKRATLAGILGFVLGAVGTYYGVPRPVTEKIVQVLVPVKEPVSPAMKPEDVYVGHAPAAELGTYPRGCRSDGFRVVCHYADGTSATFGYPSRPPSVPAADLAYYRALHREGLVPMTEHRPR